MKEVQMNWLRSEDLKSENLKEEKEATTSLLSAAATQNVLDLNWPEDRPGLVKPWGMDKRKTKKENAQSAKVTLAEVVKEMVKREWLSLHGGIGEFFGTKL
jgi:hypothetical protein